MRRIHGRHDDSRQRDHHAVARELQVRGEESIGLNCFGQLNHNGIEGRVARRDRRGSDANDRGNSLSGPVEEALIVTIHGVEEQGVPDPGKVKRLRILVRVDIGLKLRAVRGAITRPELLAVYSVVRGEENR